ncbi:hypothetical protein K438DRAFT_1614541, partial [Mycena galopus ATCC 62051]
VIISGLGTPSVLTNTGFLGFAGSLGLEPQSANLGDGHGWMELREDFGSGSLGTCWESFVGEPVYRQDGPAANSRALFLAYVAPLNVSQHHTISPNGYNIGRDLFVEKAIGNTLFDCF